MRPCFNNKSFKFSIVAGLFATSSKCYLKLERSEVLDKQEYNIILEFFILIAPLSLSDLIV